jgi:hypothetical protein
MSAARAPAALGLVAAAALLAPSWRAARAAGVPPAGSPAWTAPAPGVEVGRLPAHPGGPVVTVVRVDPRQHAFRLLSAALLGLDEPPTAPEWAARSGVLGVINAGMFQADQRTPVAYARAGDRVVNPRWNKDNAVFVAEPDDRSRAPARILDRTCDDVPRESPAYRVVLQNIRMLDCQGRNVWAQQPRRWSTACVGADADGRILLVHVRAPFSTHDLIDVLRALPLRLSRLMYVEGGPEASLYLKVGGEVVVAEMGSFETGFFESDDNRRFWPLPNVLGFAPRPER